MGDGLVRCDQQLGLAETSWYHQKQTAERKRRIFRGVEEETMTPEQGLGMLFVGVVALSIGGGIAFVILKRVYKQIHKSKRRFDDLE